MSTSNTNAGPSCDGVVTPPRTTTVPPTVCSTCRTGHPHKRCCPCALHPQGHDNNVVDTPPSPPPPHGSSTPATPATPATPTTPTTPPPSYAQSRAMAASRGARTAREESDASNKAPSVTTDVFVPTLSPLKGNARRVREALPRTPSTPTTPTGGSGKTRTRPRPQTAPAQRNRLSDAAADAYTPEPYRPHSEGSTRRPRVRFSHGTGGSEGRPVCRRLDFADDSVGDTPAAEPVSMPASSPSSSFTTGDTHDRDTSAAQRKMARRARRCARNRRQPLQIITPVSTVPTPTNSTSQSARARTPSRARSGNPATRRTTDDGHGHSRGTHEPTRGSTSTPARNPTTTPTRSARVAANNNNINNNINNNNNKLPGHGVANPGGNAADAVRAGGDGAVGGGGGGGGGRGPYHCSVCQAEGFNRRTHGRDPAHIRATERLRLAAAGGGVPAPPVPVVGGGGGGGGGRGPYHCSVCQAEGFNRRTHGRDPAHIRATDNNRRGPAAA